jgi:hypothetical protein
VNVGLIRVEMLKAIATLAAAARGSAP